MKAIKRTWLTLLFLSASLAGVFPANAYYDPSAQRWINRDPTGELHEVNLYRFVANDPVQLTDSYGHSALVWLGIIATGIGVIEVGEGVHTASVT